MMNSDERKSNERQCSNVKLDIEDISVELCKYMCSNTADDSAYPLFNDASHPVIPFHDHEVYGICCKPIPKSSVNSLASGKEK